MYITLEALHFSARGGHSGQVLYATASGGGGGGGGGGFVGRACRGGIAGLPTLA
jgi:hypothetical protein